MFEGEGRSSCGIEEYMHKLHVWFVGVEVKWYSAIRFRTVSQPFNALVISLL